MQIAEAEATSMFLLAEDHTRISPVHITHSWHNKDAFIIYSNLLTRHQDLMFN